MGTNAHDRIFRIEVSTEPSPLSADLAAMIDEEINPGEYLREITPRGMMAFAAIDLG